LRSASWGRFRSWVTISRRPVLPRLRRSYWR
jgi:hypothetical protein